MRLAILPVSVKGILAHLNKTISGTIDLDSKLQRNSGNAQAIFSGSAMLLITAQSLYYIRLCSP